jgi:Terminase large subunit, T4likevirus-type, N-terminal
MQPTTTPFPAILTNSATRLRAALKRSSTLSKEAKARLTLTLGTKLNPKDHDDFIGDFLTLGHDHQLPPTRANSGADWTTWLILGGRGAGAEWARRVAMDDPKARIAPIGETEHEAREVMVEGASGLLAVHRRHEGPQWIPTRRRLEWPKGAVAQVFSADNHEGLRGPQFSAAWCDELAKWRQVLGLGSTPALGGDVAQWAMIVLTAYFGGRSLEKVARILGRK